MTNNCACDPRRPVGKPWYAHQPGCPLRLQILTDAEDVTDDILRAAEETSEWFGPGEPMPVDEFLNRLCDTADGWDIESLDNPAVRKIMRHARAYRRGE